MYRASTVPFAYPYSHETSQYQELQEAWETIHQLSAENAGLRHQIDGMHHRVHETTQEKQDVSNEVMNLESEIHQYKLYMDYQNQKMQHLESQLDANAHELQHLRQQNINMYATMKAIEMSVLPMEDDEEESFEDICLPDSMLSSGSHLSSTDRVAVSASPSMSSYDSSDDEGSE